MLSSSPRWWRLAPSVESKHDSVDTNAQVRCVHMRVAASMDPTPTQLGGYGDEEIAQDVRGVFQLG